MTYTPEECKELERDLWSEARFTAEVLTLAAGYGWWCIHFRPARVKGGYRTAVQGNGALGFPDLLLVRAGRRMLAAELKKNKTQPTAAQSAWLDRLEAAGAETHLWRPRDWDRICEVLA